MGADYSGELCEPGMRKPGPAERKMMITQCQPTGCSGELGLTVRGGQVGRNLPPSDEPNLPNRKTLVNRKICLFGKKGDKATGLWLACPVHPGNTGDFFDLNIQYRTAVI